MKEERITHAAVKSKCGLILLGKSHADCIHQGANTGLKMSSRAKDQGFMTSKGQFLDRRQSAQVAISAKQIRPLPVEILFSEDLWSPLCGGKFQYDYIKGYFQ